MKRKWIIIASIIFIIGILAVYFSIAGKNKSSFQTVAVARGNISEEVSVTGNVEPIHSADLAFEQSGRIAGVYADVGDAVYVGETLVNLDKTATQAQFAKAQADLATQNANLNKAQIDLANDYAAVPNILNSAYTNADDAVHSKTSSLFNGSGVSYQLTFSSCDSQAALDATALKAQSNYIFANWQSEIISLNASSSPRALDQALTDAQNNLNIFNNFLQRTNANLISSCVIGNTTYDTARANLSTARTNIANALSNVTNQTQLISSQEAAVVSLQAGVQSYEANIQNIQAQLAQMTIFSPINGVVTIQNAKVGEIAPANAILVSVISGSKFDVEANVAEADIAKLKVGDQTQITLDAYGNKVLFEATVSSIDPGEKMVEGVATYKTKFQFVKPDDRVKSGMTANITIFTNKKENVLVIPQRVVTVKDGISSIMVDLGKGFSEKRQIETGLKGVDGNVEVLQGLNEGDRVIVNNS